MAYPIITELYQITAQKLLDHIEGKNFYSGSFSFNYGSKSCRFVATIIVYRQKIEFPEGPVDQIIDLVPVWWEFQTEDDNGPCPNDFSFNDLKKFISL